MLVTTYHYCADIILNNGKVKVVDGIIQTELVVNSYEK